MSEQYKCDICGAPATVHLTQIVDGNIHKVHLCEKCAGKSKVAELPILKFTEMLAKTLAAGGKKASQEISSTDAAGRTPGKVCPVCGMTDLVFEKKHLFGCSHCYEIFTEEIEDLLPKIQRGRDYRGDAGTHTQRSRAAISPAKKKTELRENLQARLSEAVRKEDYSLAAQLRDELRALEKMSDEKVSGRVKTRKPHGGNASRADPSAGKLKKCKKSLPHKKSAVSRGKKSSSGEK